MIRNNTREFSSPGLFLLLFTPGYCSHPGRVLTVTTSSPLKSRLLARGPDARPITELAGCRAASVRHRVNSNTPEPCTTLHGHRQLYSLCIDGKISLSKIIAR